MAQIMLMQYLKNLGNLIFPRICFCCERKIAEGFLCLRCFHKIEYLGAPRSSQIISIAAYKEPLITLIHSFKYRKCAYLAGFLSGLIQKHLDRLSFDFSGYDFITAVPLHKAKRKERGYNQAELLAKELSNHFKIPYRDDIIINTQVRPPQAKLSQKERNLNVEGLFRVEKSLKNKRLILIDDTLTTGATVKACSAALEEKETEKVTIITLAKTLYHENTS